MVAVEPGGRADGTVAHKHSGPTARWPTSEQYGKRSCNRQSDRQAVP